MSYVVKILSFAFLFALLFSGNASAHRSGCHSWHSCPSDSGSYVCGDQGYTSGCPAYSPPPPPDYTAQGITNGKVQAITNELSISSAANISAQSKGRVDGSSGLIESPDYNATATCDKTFTFTTTQSQEYIDAFHDGYLTNCAVTYRAAYVAAYNTAFIAANNYRINSLASNQIISPIDPPSDNSGCWYLSGIGFVGLLGAISLKKK